MSRPRFSPRAALILQIISAVSLLFFLTACIRSYIKPEFLSWGNEKSGNVVSSYLGTVSLFHCVIDTVPASSIPASGLLQRPFQWTDFSYLWLQETRSTLGFRFERVPGPDRSLEVACPYGLLILLSALPLLRRFFSLFVWVCSPLFLVLLILTIKSYIQPDRFQWSSFADYSMEFSHGSLYVDYSVDEYFGNPHRPWAYRTDANIWHLPTHESHLWLAPEFDLMAAQEKASNFLGARSIGLIHGFLGAGHEVRRACTKIPCWMPLLLFGIMPAIGTAGFLRRRGAAPGLCTACNYDLRAHAAGAKCPECGTPNPTDKTPHGLPSELHNITPPPASS